jgi:hypothetical protein
MAAVMPELSGVSHQNKKFRYNFPVSNAMKIRSVVLELLHATDGWVDSQQSGAFMQLCCEHI